jgi:IS5 family transposase
VQQWFNLSDLGVEEAMYESPVLRRFVGVDRWCGGCAG